jgi:hypothetical protein
MKNSRYSALLVTSVSYVERRKCFETKFTYFNCEDYIYLQSVWKESCVQSAGLVLHWELQFQNHIAHILETFAKLLFSSSSLSVHLSVCKEQLGYQWTDLHEIRHLLLLRKSVGNNLTRITGPSHEDLCTSMITSRWIFLRKFQTKIEENQSPHFMFNICFPKIVLFFRKCGKILHSHKGHRWQYYMVYALFMLHN